MVRELSPVQSGLHHGNDIEVGGEEELLEGAEEGGIQLNLIPRRWTTRIQECHLVGSQTERRTYTNTYHLQHPHTTSVPLHTLQATEPRVALGTRWCMRYSFIAV